MSPSGAVESRSGLGGGRVAGAVVRMEGVARPLALVLGLEVADTLGPLVCRGGRERNEDEARGVAAGSIGATEPFLLGMGVKGTGFAEIGASDSGGEGGEASGGSTSALECGGVEAAVTEEMVVAEVEASETGERGLKASPAR
jgi:hypothetical protein